MKVYKKVHVYGLIKIQVFKGEIKWINFAIKNAA